MGCGVWGMAKNKSYTPDPRPQTPHPRKINPNMTNLYLHYRATTSDPWTAVPSLASAFPSLASGALPVQSVTIASEPEVVTPQCCEDGWLPDASADDSYLALRVKLVPIPLALAATVITFLMQYRDAALLEAKYIRYGQGGYVTAKLSLITAHEKNGMAYIAFRLAATMSDALLNT
jgi:hypothetical protein